MYRPSVVFYGFLAMFCMMMRVAPYLGHSVGLNTYPSEEIATPDHVVWTTATLLLWLKHAVGFMSWYPWNYSPFNAFCIFSGATLKSRSMAVWLPLGMLVVSDAIIFALTGRVDWVLYPGAVLVYGAYLLMIALGRQVVRTSALTPAKLMFRGAMFGLTGEVAFFLLTNLGVWLFGNGINYTYSHDLNGLVLCYVAAIPFAKNSFLSMALFAPLLFSPLVVRWRTQPAIESQSELAMNDVYVA